MVAVAWIDHAFRSGQVVDVNQQAKKRIAKARSEKLCVACLGPLDGKRVVRGCHERCYRATMRSIANGKTTDASRVAQGKLLAADHGGGKPSNPVTVEIYAKR